MISVIQYHDLTNYKNYSQSKNPVILKNYLLFLFYFLNIIYNLADVLNKIIFGMIIYSAALEDTKKKGA